MKQELPVIKTELPGPKSQVLQAEREKYVARGVGTSYGVFVAEASDATITDVDGNVFIDVAAGIGVQNVGHTDPSVVEAVQAQASKYIHPCFHVVGYEPYIALAQKLAAVYPASFPIKVMLSNSGAEAVENAVKIARRATGKSGIVSLDNAFHGRTSMTMALTSKLKPYGFGFGPFPSDLYKTPSAYCYRCPLSAVAGRAEMMDAPFKGQIGGTYGGAPISCAAALAVLSKIERDDLPGRARHIGDRIMTRIHAMKEKYPCIGDARGLGAMIGLEFVHDRTTKEPDTEIISRITAYAFKHGVILLSAGILGNVVRLLPPLVMTDVQIDFVMDTLDAAIAAAIE